MHGRPTALMDLVLTEFEQKACQELSGIGLGTALL
jgi:hypothetical protein